MHEARKYGGLDFIPSIYFPSERKDGEAEKKRGDRREKKNSGRGRGNTRQGQITSDNPQDLLKSLVGNKYGCKSG